MRTRELRRNYEAKKQKKYRKIEKDVGYFYGGYEFKNKDDKYEFDPYKCYYTDAKKHNSKSYFKKVSNKAVRRWHKKEIRDKMEDASTCNNSSSNKIYEYRWTVF